MIKIDEHAKFTEIYAAGELAKEDYEHDLIPYFKKVKEQNEKVNLMVVFDEDFDYKIHSSKFLDELCDRFGPTGHINKVAVVIHNSRVASRLIKVNSLFYNHPIASFSNREDARVFIENNTNELVVEYDSVSNVLHGKLLGELNAEGFAHLEEVVEKVFTQRDRLSGAVLTLREGLHYADMATMMNHLMLVTKYEGRIDRIAICVNDENIGLIPKLIQGLNSKKIHFFKLHNVVQANEFVQEDFGEELNI